MKKNIAIIITIVLTLGIVWYIYTDIKKVDSNGSNATTTLSGLGIDFEGEGITVEEVPIEEVVQPSFDRKIVFPTSFSPEAQTIIKKKIADVVVELKTDPRRVDKWMEYGSYFNALNDYKSASKIWEYAKLLNPNLPEIYSDLGFLYGYNLKNVEKGEENFLLSVNFAQKQVQYYINAAQFYVDILQDKAKALKVVEAGLSQVPDDKNLQAMKVKLTK